MSPYFLMVDKLIEDHFSESEKEALRLKLGNKAPAPTPMTDTQKRRAALLENMNKRKKK